MRQTYPAMSVALFEQLRAAPEESLFLALMEGPHDSARVTCIGPAGSATVRLTMFLHTDLSESQFSFEYDSKQGAFALSHDDAYETVPIPLHSRVFRRFIQFCNQEANWNCADSIGIDPFGTDSFGD